MKLLITLFRINCLLLLLSCCSFTAPPRYLTSVEEFNKATQSVCSGDFIKEGYGCVTGELKDYGAYKTLIPGVNNPQALMFSETFDNKVYFYIFNPEQIEYDRISLSTSTEKITDTSSINYNDTGFNETFKDFELVLVSFSSNNFYQKYLIVGLNPDLKIGQRRYAVREIYKNDDKSKSYLPLGIEYMVSKNAVTNKLETQVNNLVTFNVTNKAVYFMITGGVYDQYVQNQYAVFNLNNSNKLNLQSVKLIYNVHEYSCSWDSGKKIIAGINVLNEFREQFKGQKVCGNDLKLYPEKSITKTITPEKTTITFTPGFIFGHKSYTWNTLGKVEDLKDPTPEIKNYTYYVNFLNNNFTFENRKDNDFSNNRFGVGQAFYTDYENIPHPQEVSELSLLQLTYEDNGEIKSAIVADTYTDSSGSQDIAKPKKEWWEYLLDIFYYLIEHWWILVLLIAIPLISILITLITGSWNILKSLGFVLSLPFKGLWWLITPLKKKGNKKDEK